MSIRRTSNPSASSAPAVAPHEASMNTVFPSGQCTLHASPSVASSSGGSTTRSNARLDELPRRRVERRPEGERAARVERHEARVEMIETRIHESQREHGHFADAGDRSERALRRPEAPASEELSARRMPEQISASLERARVLPGETSDLPSPRLEPGLEQAHLSPPLRSVHVREEDRPPSVRTLERQRSGSRRTPCRGTRGRPGSPRPGARSRGTPPPARPTARAPGRRPRASTRPRRRACAD